MDYERRKEKSQRWCNPEESYNGPLIGTDHSGTTGSADPHNFEGQYYHYLHLTEGKTEVQKD